MKEFEKLKSKVSSQEFLKTIISHSNDVYKEGEKIKKGFVKNEIPIDKFISEYMKSRKEFHEIDLKKNKL